MAKPDKYEVDTKFIEFLINMCLTVAIFSIAFLIALQYTEIQNKFVESLYIIFLILFTLFLAITFGLFIKWYTKYKVSLFKI